MNVPEVCVPESGEKLERQIAALKSMLRTDKDEFSREVHRAALKKLEAAFAVECKKRSV